jgi:hypothetical protein
MHINCLVRGLAFMNKLVDDKGQIRWGIYDEAIKEVN